VATIFGVSLLAFAMAAGVALDYSRSYSLQSSLQSDLDSAILAAAHKADDLAAATLAAESFLVSNWKAHKLGSGTVSVSVTQPTDSTIRGTATLSVPTTLMAIAGIETVMVTAQSEVALTSQDVEVALVLDTTGSMSGAKLAALKDAAKGLIDAAYEKPHSEEHIKIAVVPFSEHVNVGISRRNESWLDVAPDSTTTEEVCSEVTPVIGTSNCRMETFSGTNDGVPYSYEAEVCDSEYGPPETQCSMVTTVREWHGCVGSRASPLDTKDEDYATKVPGIDVWCGAEITPLTSDEEVLKDGIDSLSAAYETYIPAGLMWGWAMLSSQAPFDEAVPYGHKVDGNPVRKILVLMTDGKSTRSATYPEHWGSDTDQANTLTSELCINIKEKSIEIFTVAFELEDGPIKDILRDCASKPANYFEPESEDELENGFADIGKDLAPLRIAH
jgi:Flp pilus assembly protein TadG